MGVRLSCVNTTGSQRQSVLATQVGKRLADNISCTFGSQFLSSLTPYQLEIDVSELMKRTDVVEYDGGTQQEEGIHQEERVDFTQFSAPIEHNSSQTELGGAGKSDSPPTQSTLTQTKSLDTSTQVYISTSAI